MTTIQVGEGGEIVLPAEVCRSAGIIRSSFVVIERVEGGVLVRPAEDVEAYTAERKAEFLLTNAIDGTDYAAAVRSVRQMGLDPDHIPHRRPAGA